MIAALRLFLLAAARQLGGITLLRSGLPFGIDSNANTTDSQRGRQRANRVGNGFLDRGERTLSRFFDTEAFVSAPASQFGNSPRFVIRGPGLVNFDLMLGNRRPANPVRAETRLLIS